MDRANIGISKLSVSEEIDPGFGPDTEQRRVEFAAKLEDEAFSIAIGDATKLAKRNIITALKLWEKEDLIPLVEKLNLRDIMLIWLLFEIVVFIEVWEEAITKDQKKIFLKIDKNLQKLIDAFLTPLLEDIPERPVKVAIDLTEIAKIRENFGGDLIFSLRSKNEQEVIKIYEMTYSKLPKSLREQFLQTVIGIHLSYKEIIKIIKSKKNILQEIIKLFAGKINNSEDFSTQAKTEIAKIVGAYSQQASDALTKALIAPVKKTKEVEDKVKSFYGIK